MTDVQPDVLTLAEAAKLLRLSTKTVGKLAAAGKIPGRRLDGANGRWRFSRRALLTHLETPDGHRSP